MGSKGALLTPKIWNNLNFSFQDNKKYVNIKMKSNRLNYWVEDKMVDSSHDQNKSKSIKLPHKIIRLVVILTQKIKKR